jgi:hypothetical protein
MSSIRVEYRAPGRHGLGGGWFASCGEIKHVRFYGREPAPDSRLDALPEDERTRLVDAMLAALEKAQIARVRRLNRARQFRDGMRSLSFFALRHSADRTARPLVVATRPRRQTTRRYRIRRSGHRRARAPTSSSPADEDGEQHYVAPAGVVV